MRLAAAVLLAAALAACATQPEGPRASPDIGPAGTTYALAAVDAQPLPAVAYFGVDVAIQATKGDLALAADHGYTLDLEFNSHFASGNRDVPFTQPEQGRWSGTGSDILLTSTSGLSHKVTLSGDSLQVVLTVADADPPDRATKSYTFRRVH
jgi:DsbC/DsbD-like thiol-disulfide interchange protein